MGEPGRVFILFGVLLVVVGVSLVLVGRVPVKRAPGVGRLPGDIILKGKNFTFCFPLTTCLAVSALLTLILWLLLRFRQ